MEEEARLGIPDDERAAAPQKRFALGERQVRMISRLLGPLTLLAWGALASKVVAGELQDRSQHTDKDDPARPAKAEARGPSNETSLQTHHDAPAPHHAPAQVVPLHDLRAWRSPDVASVDLAEYAPRRGDTPVDYQAMRHHPDAAVPAGQSPTISAPVNDAPFVFSPTSPQPEEAPVEARPGEPPPKTPVATNARPKVAGPVVLGRGFRNEAMLITAAILLAGASDADGDTLNISDLSCQGGTFTSYGAGVWLFTPDQDLTGPIEILYSISDGTDHVAQTARLNLVVPPGQQIEGTSGDDVLVGTPLADVISGSDGEDLIYAREGADVVDGGGGNDRIIGGSGNDILHGGEGNDLIFGGAGDDNIFGDGGDDAIDAGDGNDFADGGDGNDTIDGGAGNDLILGGAGDDDLTGGDGNDVVFGGAGNDVLRGGDGADVIDPGTGRDSVDAGAGDDRIVVVVLDENDHFDGGAGSDTIDLSAIHDAIVVNLAAGSIRAAGNDASVSMIAAIENVIAGGGDDTIIADASVNVLVGGEGDDRFVFPDIESLQNGGFGNDIVGDFQAGDRIDLSQISERMNDYAAIKLFFAGYGSDGPLLGAVWYVFDDSEDNGRTIITGHVALSDEQQDEDFSISLLGHQSVTNANFVFEYHALIASV